MFGVFSELRTKKNVFTVFSELRTKKTNEIHCFRDFVVLGQENVVVCLCFLSSGQKETQVLLCSLSSGQNNVGFTVFSELWTKVEILNYQIGKVEAKATAFSKF